MAKPRMTYKYQCEKCEKVGNITNDDFCECGGQFFMAYVEIPPEPYTRY